MVQLAPGQAPGASARGGIRPGARRGIPLVDGVGSVPHRHIRGNSGLTAAVLTPVVTTAVKHDTSPALRTIRPKRTPDNATQLRQVLQPRIPHEALDASAKTGSGAVQRDVVTNAMPSFGQNFEGLGNLNGVLPPDTQGDVGKNHYVQMINLSFAVYDKQGNILYGPVPNTTLRQASAARARRSTAATPSRCTTSRRIAGS